MSPTTETLTLKDLSIKVPLNISAEATLRYAIIGGQVEGGLNVDHSTELSIAALGSRAESINGVTAARSWIKIYINKSLKTILNIDLKSQASEEKKSEIYKAIQTAFWQNAHCPEKFNDSQRESSLSVLRRLLNVTENENIIKFLDDLKQNLSSAKKINRPRIPVAKTFAHDDLYSSLEAIIDALGDYSEIKSERIKVLASDEIVKMVKMYFKEITKKFNRLDRDMIVEISKDAPLSEDGLRHYCSNQKRFAKMLTDMKILFSYEPSMGPSALIANPLIRLYARISEAKPNETDKLLRDPKLIDDLNYLRKDWNNLELS